MSDPENTNTNTKAKTKTYGWVASLLKAVGSIVAIMGLVWTVYSYLDTRALEAKKPFLEFQFKLYEEAVAVTGRLATAQCLTGDEKCIGEYADDCDRFEELYWGGLAVVEDELVEKAMVAFRNEFKLVSPDICKPDSLSAVATSGERKNLKSVSLSLAHCVNASLHRSWQVDLLPDRCAYSKPVAGWRRLFGLGPAGKQ